jgi:hypothetical protein
LKEHKIEPIGLTFQADDAAAHFIMMTMAAQAALVMAVQEFRKAGHELAKAIHDNGGTPPDNIGPLAKSFGERQERLFEGAEAWTITMAGLMQKTEAAPADGKPIDPASMAPAPGTVQ